ncbi:MAG: glycosyltransferase [Clostridia bacterium]|nr:glycosyltransferase [Clostridia bacterium]
MDKNLPLISVVVPVYNVEKYLSKCIESVLAQTYPNIEIILVDDGAKDNSGAICDEYARRDERIRVIHKENGGLSDARNRGISEARGEYVGLVDSDDYIDADMYETLYGLISEYDAQIAMCGLYDVYEGKPARQVDSIESSCYDKVAAMKMVLEAKVVSVTAVNKLYRRSMFESVSYPVGRTAEDAFVILHLLSQAERVAITNERKYYYFHRENSITTRSFSKRDFDAIAAYEHNYSFICENFPELEKTAKMRLYWANFYVLDKMMLSQNATKSDYMPLVKYIRGGISFILFDDCFLASRKLAALVLCFSVGAYKRLVVSNTEKNKKINA